MPDYSKDVVIAILGASIGLAGLLLVVSGFVLAMIASFPPQVPNARIRRYEWAAKAGLLPFVLALSDAATGMAWMLHGGSWLYQWTVRGFFALLILTGAYGVILLLEYL
jgi:hypothetical protein